MSEVKILALGGLGEIGKNCMVFEYEEEACIVDCGLMFPEENMLGADIAVCDFAYLESIKHKIKGLVLTHGHEDHIGGIPYLLKTINVPIYGSEFTLALIKEKLKNDFDVPAELNTVRAFEKVEFKYFSFEFIPVRHSIVDSYALFIETPVGHILHSGDFKDDPTPIKDESISLKSFKKIGKKGVLLLLCDSTNAEYNGRSKHEKEVAQEIDNIFKACKGRLLVSLFASNVQRVNQVVVAAKKYNRKIVMDGKSIITYVKVAREHGYINASDDIFMTPKEINGERDDEIIFLLTGNQGEPRSSLVRIAMDAHKKIKIKAGDTVLLSSKFIPGNEKAIGNVINQLCRLGASVIYEKVSKSIHGSGHAHKKEIIDLFNYIKPKYFIPIHGEYRHLTRSKSIFVERGVDPERIMIIENGDQLSLSENKMEITDKISVHKTFIDTDTYETLEDDILRDRKRIGLRGLVFCSLIIEAKYGVIISGPELFTRGCISEEEQDIIKKAEEELKKEVERAMKDLGGAGADLEEIIRLKIRRIFKKETGQRPIIVMSVTEI
ncbi:MAG: ribonuclease J [Pseudomonadota bacterium]